MTPSERELRQTVESIDTDAGDCPNLPIAYLLSADDMQNEIQEVPNRPDLVRINGTVYDYPSAELINPDESGT
jgi:hypothetical protein